MPLTAEPQARTPQSLPNELWAFLLAVAALWAVSLLDALGFTGAAPSFGRIHLLNPKFDLTCYVGRFLNHTGLNFFARPGFMWNYPAPCAFIYRYLYLFASGQPAGDDWRLVVGYEATAACLLAGLGFLLVRALARRGLATSRAILLVTATAVTSWPVYFAIERGNIEVILWVGFAAATHAYARRRWMLSAILLGVVAAFKIYPILCFALFLPPRKYRQIAIGLAATAATTLLGLLFLGPTVPIAARNTAKGIKTFVAIYSRTYDPVVIGYDHSAFSLIKVMIFHHPASIPKYLFAYTALAGLLALIAFFLRIAKMPRPNQVLMLSVVSVLLPSTSFDYTLETLYVPWAWLTLLLVAAQRSGRKLPGAMPAMLCFALLFAPETFLHAHDVLFAGQVKALMLIALIAISMIFPFDEVNGPESETRAFAF